MDSLGDEVLADHDQEEDIIDYTDVIEVNHLDLVQQLQLDRHFLFSFLRSKGTIDEEDIELITNSGNTRQQRVSRFLDMIKRKGNVGMAHFVNALQHENPALYEKLTGKKANPITVELPGMDHSFLAKAKQLAHTIQEMQSLTHNYNKVVGEKDILEKKLKQAEQSLSMKEEEVKYLMKINETISKKSQVDGFSEMLGPRVCELMNQQEHKIFQKDYHVTVLQGKMIDMIDQNEILRKENQELKMKNYEYARENLELQFCYNSEKRQSFLLKEKVKDQEYDRSYIDKYKSDMKQNMTDMIKIREENMELKKMVDEFHKYGELLSTKFKLVVKEKTNFYQKQRSLSNVTHEQISELVNANSMLKIEKEHLRRANERLVGDVNLATELQNTFHNEWKKASEECEKLHKSLEDTSQEKHRTEEVVQSHIGMITELNKKYNEVCKELDDLQISFEKCNKGVWTTEKEVIPQIEVSLLGNEKEEEVEETKYLDIESPDFFKKKRSHKQVLDSIKRHVLLPEYPDCSSPENIHLRPKSNLIKKTATLPLDAETSSPEKLYMGHELNDEKKAVTLPPGLGASTFMMFMKGFEYTKDSSDSESSLGSRTGSDPLDEGNSLPDETANFRCRTSLIDTSKGKPTIRSNSSNSSD